MNITINSYGTQTISDNSLYVIDQEMICFPIEGELIFFNFLQRNIIKKIRLSFSLIKCIGKYSEKEILVATEGAEVFIVTLSSWDMKLLCHLKMVNNVYWMDISNDRKYLALSTHVISNESNREIIIQEDAIIVLDIENDIRIIQCFPSKNNFCCFYQKNMTTKVISFNKKANGNTYAITYDLNGDEPKAVLSFILPIAAEIHRIKLVHDYVILGCIKRFYYLFDLSKQDIVFSIHFEGNCEMGEFDCNEHMLYIAPCAGRLYEINYIALLKTGKDFIDISPQINTINNATTPIREIASNQSGIKNVNWGLKVIKGSTAIIANEEGLNIISLSNANESFVYNDKHHLSMSGCGICINSTNNNIAMGDLGGNITHYNSLNQTLCKIALDNEMIRALDYNEINNEVLIGVMSGKVYRCNSINNTIKLLSNCQNDQTITCIRIYELKSLPYLIFSTIKGEIFFYSYDYNKDDYKYLLKFQAHLPQKDNTNMLFGSLGIKAEIWSFIVNPKSYLSFLNENDVFYLASASEDQTVKIWSISLNKLNIVDFNGIKNIKIIKDHSLAVTCVDWKKMNLNEHKEMLISCSDDRTVNGYDPLNDFNHFFTVDIGKMLYGFFTLTYIALEENSTSFAVGSQIGYLMIYSINNNSYIFIEKIHYGGIEGLSWKGTTIATCGNDNIFNIMKI